MLRSLDLPWNPDEVYRVPTADGASIAMGRYFPRIERRFASPVILCHGLGANRFDLDLDERYSVARFLAGRGFESWVLELRGRGLAGRPHDATFDEQAKDDVTAALNTALSAGAKDVVWVGHSKGGLLAFAHLGRNPNAPIRAIVALGSPTRLANHKLLPLLRAAKPLLSLPVLPLRMGARLVAPLGMPPGPWGPFLANTKNMEPHIVRKSIHNVAADIPGGVARQFARWLEQGVFDGEDGFDYFAALERIRIPVMLVAGAQDQMAPTASVFAAKEKLGGLVDAIEFPGFGHGDLTVGRSAPELIFPRIAQFLERHAAPQ